MTILLQNSVGEGTRAPCCPQLRALDTGKSAALQKVKPCRQHVPSFIPVPQHCQGAPALLGELRGDPGPAGAPLCCCPVLAQAGSGGGRHWLEAGLQSRSLRLRVCVGNASPSVPWFVWVHSTVTEPELGELGNSSPGSSSQPREACSLCARR